MTPSWDLWTGLRLRAVSSTGTQLALWAPADSVYPVVGPELTWPEVVIERRTTGDEDYSVIKGVRPTVEVTIETLTGHFGGSGLTVALEDVINARMAARDNAYELALHYLGRMIGGPGVDIYDWKKVRLSSGFQPEALGGKPVGLRVALTFEAVAIQQTLIARDATGVAW